MVDLRYGAATDVGRRQVNEDSWLARPPVFVVADGMGGHHAGRAASGAVVEEFARLAAGDVTSERVAETIGACQARIAGISSAQPHLAHAGTTLVACVLVRGDRDAPYWLVVNVGDSRAYRMDQGELERVSVDHSVVQELVDAGQITEAEAVRHPERHVVTRVLGSPEAVSPDYFLLAVESSERILLCSDGVSGALDDTRLAALLRACPEPARAAERVVAEALAAGGRDNATAVVVDVVGWEPQRPPGTTLRRRTPEDEDAAGDTLQRPRPALRSVAAE